MDELITAERKIIFASFLGDIVAQKIYDELITLGHNFYDVNKSYTKLADAEQYNNISSQDTDIFAAADIDTDEFNFRLQEYDEDPRTVQDCYKYLIEEGPKLIKKQLIKQIGSKLFKHEATDKDLNDFDEQYNSIKPIRKRKSLLDIAKSIDEESRLYESGNLKILKTGIEELDKIIVGMRREDIFIVGARSGKGKTHMLAQWTKNYLEAGHKVLFITNEMSEEEILTRFGSHIAHEYEGAINDDPKYSDRKKKLLAGIKEFSEKYNSQLEILRIPVYEDAMRIIKLVGRMKSADVIIVDYIQNFITKTHYADDRTKLMNMCNEIMEFVKSARIPMLISSQMVDGEHMFKGAQDILNMATVAMTIERNSEKQSENLLYHYKARIDVRKNRRGATGVVYGKIFSPDPTFHCLDPDSIEIKDWDFNKSPYRKY